MKGLEDYTVVINGLMPLIMHGDHVALSERVQKWRKDPVNKNSPKGDDKFPPWTWSTYLNLHDELVCLTTEQLTRALVEAGKSFKIGRKNMKGIVAALIQFKAPGFPLLIGKDSATLDNGTVQKIAHMDNFRDHEEPVKNLGFVLDERRAKVGMSKHIRCRPKFTKWACVAQFRVNNLGGELPHEIINDMFNYCGIFCGFGDWRPSSIMPGPYGTFNAHVIPGTLETNKALAAAKKAEV